MYNYYFYFIFILTPVVTVKTEYIQVNIPEGSLLGKSASTEGLGKNYYAFQGIPYAEPPERFELSIPKTPWTGILNCTEDKAKCVQGTETVSGSEDCLFLSVYTVNLTSSSTVMVWIHGGSFSSGNAFYNTFQPDYFVDEDIVVVEIQYRLGVLGFLSTGDLVCPGNLGLKDQALALKWVQKNIQYFGGDPKKVTIFGQSAGAASVSLHLTSKMSQGLFKGVIMNSGNSLCLWSLSRQPVRIATLIGQTLGINATTSSSLIQQLKFVNYKTLQQVASKVLLQVTPLNPLAGINLAPVIEVPHSTAFLTGKSYDMFLKGNFYKVPILTGFNSNESVELVTPLLKMVAPQLEQNPGKLVPADIVSSKNRTEIGLLIKSEFWKNETIDNLEKTVEFVNVDQFVRPINKFVVNVRKFVPTYYYIFNYEATNKKLLGLNYKGVAHEDELAFLFNKNISYSREDQNIRLKAVRMWSNFCKYGRPIPRPDRLLNNSVWLPAASDQRPFLFSIDSTMGRTKNPYQKQLDFYEYQIYGKYGQGTYDTY